MSILERELQTKDAGTETGPKRHLFSRQEYEEIARAGIFDDQRVELIEGDIVDMAPIGDAHAALTDPIVMLLNVAFGPGFTVRSQVPIVLVGGRGPSEPQPDVTVAVGSWRDYLSRKPGPGDIRLIVEVADSSLTNDRTTKAALYALAGIPEYWIVNLVGGKLEVYREPIDGSYGSVVEFEAADQVTPLFAKASVSVSDFMP